MRATSRHVLARDLLRLNPIYILTSMGGDGLNLLGNPWWYSFGSYYSEVAPVAPEVSAIVVGEKSEIGHGNPTASGIGRWKDWINGWVKEEVQGILIFSHLLGKGGQ